MSHKTTINTHSKSLTEKKIPTIKYSKTQNLIKKEEYEVYDLFSQHSNYLYLYLITHHNLIKYNTTKKKYNISIINSIIFDQRIHKVAVFKNNLLWDETSEFLKRFYKQKESIERIPKIAEYYQKYTLFPPVYFGLEGFVLIIMNKWTKRKKNYLEYIEDHEEERERKKNKKKNTYFEPLISPSLITNKTSSKSIISKNTLDLSKYDNESIKKIINNKNYYLNSNMKNYNKAIYNNSKDIKKEKINSLSFSEIIDDLSSQYSIILNNDTNNNIISNKENNKKYKKNQNNNANKKNIKERRNEINVNKARNTYYSNTSNNSKINNMIKPSKIKTVDSPRKTIKISLNNKNNKYILTNNNTNIIKRNKFNYPLPLETKKYQKKVLNTENNAHRTQDFPNNVVFCKKNSTKGAIKVNVANYNFIMEKSKNENDNNLLEKENSTKKLNSNFIKNSIQKNIINNKKKYSDNIIKSGNLNSLDKNLVNKNNNFNNIIKQQNFVQNKKKSSTELNNIFNNLNNHKTLTCRNYNNPQMHYYQEKPFISNLNNKIASLNNIHKDSININDIKNTKDNQKKHKKLYLEDPFVYKLTQLTKKKQISLTSVNSLNKIKDDKKFSHYGINNIIENNNNLNSNFNYNANKANYRKNLVLTKINSKKNLIYNNKSKLLGEDIVRNNSTSLHKNNENSISLNFPGKISNSHSFKPNKNNNTNNINLNLNLNIHFNIDMENKNKGKKILLNNSIINQLQNKINKNNKYSNPNKNRDIICQYPLTSRNTQRHLKNLSNTNKYEYTIMKKY